MTLVLPLTFGVSVVAGSKSFSRRCRVPSSFLWFVIVVLIVVIVLLLSSSSPSASLGLRFAITNSIKKHNAHIFLCVYI
uniref:Uncharacterized protein n=1 Tax=Peronospora matthiolae TaxID=2874970 RepID=A0AAV1T8U1_9STRA